VYHYYDKLTASESGTSDKIIQKELRSLDFGFEEGNSATGNSHYD
jgi:hypothetical protein